MDTSRIYQTNLMFVSDHESIFPLVKLYKCKSNIVFMARASPSIETIKEWTDATCEAERLAAGVSTETRVAI